MAGFFNCSFARVAARNSVYDENGKVQRDKSTRLQKFSSTFEGNREAFAVTQNTFDKRLPVLLKNFHKWRGEDKSKYLEHFSSTAWSSLSAAKKGLHTISSCSACQTNHPLFQSLFPLRSNRLKRSDPLSTCTREVACLRKAVKAVKPSKATIQDTAKNIYLKINQHLKTFTTLTLLKP